MGLSRSSDDTSSIAIIRVAYRKSDPKTWTKFRLLGGEEILDTHFVPGIHRTMPHLTEACPWCTGAGQIKAMAYLPCLCRQDLVSGPTIGLGLLELPGVVARQIPRPRRGLGIEVLRSEDKRHHVRLVDEPVRAAPGSGVIAQTLPEPFDPIEVLLRYWRLKREDIESPGEIEQPDVIRFRKQA